MLVPRFNLVRRVNDSHPVHRLRSEMDRLFEDVFEGFGFPRLGGDPWFSPGFPAVNLWEDADNVYAEAELPGLKLEDIELTVAGDELTLKGERKACCDRKEATYHRQERSTGSFVRVIRLGMEVDADRIEAALRDGVLRITLPKSAQAKPRKVEVKGG